MTECISDLSKRTGQYHWLLNEVLAGIPLRQIAEAFGVSPATVMRQKERLGIRPSPRMASLMQRAIKLMQDLCSENGLELSQWTELKLTEEEVQTWLLEQISSSEYLPPASEAARQEILFRYVNWIRKTWNEANEITGDRGSHELGDSESKEFLNRIQSSYDAMPTSIFELALTELRIAIGKSRSETKAKFVKRVTQLARELEVVRPYFQRRVFNQECKVIEFNIKEALGGKQRS